MDVCIENNGVLHHILVESSLFPHLHLLYNPKVNFTKIVNAVAQFFATRIWGVIGRDPAPWEEILCDVGVVGVSSDFNLSQEGSRIGV